MISQRAGTAKQNSPISMAAAMFSEDLSFFSMILKFKVID